MVVFIQRVSFLDTVFKKEIPDSITLSGIFSSRKILEPFDIVPLGVRGALPSLPGRARVGPLTPPLSSVVLLQSLRLAGCNSTLHSLPAAGSSLH